jgi:hypothetical protein
MPGIFAFSTHNGLSLSGLFQFTLGEWSGNSDDEWIEMTIIPVKARCPGL